MIFGALSHDGLAVYGSFSGVNPKWHYCIEEENYSSKVRVGPIVLTHIIGVASLWVDSLFLKAYIRGMHNEAVRAMGTNAVSPQNIL